MIEKDQRGERHEFNLEPESWVKKSSPDIFLLNIFILNRHVNHCCITK